MQDPVPISLPPRTNETFASVSEFFLGPIIGDGGFAKVRRGTHKVSKAKYALKIMRLASMGRGDIENIEKELEIHSKLDSPYVVKLVDFFVEQGFVYMVLEMADKGSLYSYMFKHFPLPQTEALRFWVGAVRGIDYLHSQDIYMRDLKSENVLLDRDLRVKLCDFGWASRMRDVPYRKLRGGTYIYMSPEGLRGELQDLASDLWALGVLLFELLHSTEPYKIGLSSKEQLQIIADSDIRFKDNLDARIKKLIQALMSPDKALRPSTAQILALDWVRDFDPEAKGKGGYRSPRPRSRSKNVSGNCYRGVSNEKTGPPKTPGPKRGTVAAGAPSGCPNSTGSPSRCPRRMRRGESRSALPFRAKPRSCESSGTAPSWTLGSDSGARPTRKRGSDATQIWAPTGPSRRLGARQGTPGKRVWDCRGTPSTPAFRSAWRTRARGLRTSAESLCNGEKPNWRKYKKNRRQKKRRLALKGLFRAKNSPLQIQTRK